MPAISYPGHILFAPVKAFFANMIVWMTAMIFTLQPMVFLFGWAPCHMIFVILYYRDPYFPEVVLAWWQSRTWPKSRQTRNLYPAAGNKYLP